MLSSIQYPCSTYLHLYACRPESEILPGAPASDQSPETTKDTLESISVPQVLLTVSSLNTRSCNTQQRRQIITNMCMPYQKLFTQCRCIHYICVPVHDHRSLDTRWEKMPQNVDPGHMDMPNHLESHTQDITLLSACVVYAIAIQ